MDGCPIQSTCAKCKNSKGLGGVPGQSHRWGSRGEPRWCSYIFVLFCFVLFCFVLFFNAETEFQCQLICSLDDHVHLKTMMRPRGYSSMIGYGRAADTWKVDPFLYQILPKNETHFYPSSNQRGWIVPTPLTFFSPGRSKTLKKVTKGIIGNLFTSFAVIFMKKKIGGTTLPGVGLKQSKSEGERVDATFFNF